MMKKILIYLFGLLCCYACSDTTPTDINEETAQHYYDTTKGTYVGNIIVDNIPQKIYITVDNDITIRPVPVKPILSHIFTNDTELEEAVASAGNVVFTVTPNYMAIVSGNVVMNIEPKDLVFTVTVNQKTYQVSALMDTSVFVNRTTDELSLTMVVQQLSCDGKSYDVTTNGIVYIVDSAKKDQN
jgi:hypothetical protein